MQHSGAHRRSPDEAVLLYWTEQLLRPTAQKPRPQTDGTNSSAAPTRPPEVVDDRSTSVAHAPPEKPAASPTGGVSLSVRSEGTGMGTGGPHRAEAAPEEPADSSALQLAGSAVAVSSTTLERPGGKRQRLEVPDAPRDGEVPTPPPTAVVLEPSAAGDDGDPSPVDGTLSAPPPPSMPGATLSAAAVAVPTGLPVLRDAMPLFESLLAGHLGPVALDVRLQGHTSLLLNPVGFEQIVESHTGASSAALRRLLASIQPYFLLRGGKYYTLDNSTYPVLPLLAALLRAPRATKVVVHANLLYRLMFLFLGTDRVEPEGVVDVEVWEHTVRHHRPPMASLMGTSAGTALSGPSSITVESLLAYIASESQRLLVGVIGCLTDDEAPSTPPRVLSTSPMSGTAPHPSRIESFGEGAQHTAHSGNLVGSTFPGATTAAEGAEQGVDISLDTMMAPTARRAAETTATTVARPPLFSTRRTASPLAALQPLLRGLGAALLYYEQRLAPFASGGVVAPLPLLRGSGPPSSRMVSDVCARRTYVTFLCEAMRFHGLTVRQDLFEQYTRHLDEQMSTLQAMSMKTARGRSDQTAPIDVTTMSAALLRDTLLRSVLTTEDQQRLHKVLNTPPVPPRGDTASANKALVVHLRRSLAMIGPTCQHAVRFCDIWLAWSERRHYKDTLQSMLRDLGSHLHVRVQPTSQNLHYTVHPQWSLHFRSTNRIFSSTPNLQQLPKTAPTAHFAIPSVTADHETDTNATDPALMFSTQPTWTVRHLYAAPAGCTLLSFDYNQIELRVLAQLSGDQTLRDHLNAGVDVLALLARMAGGLGESAPVPDAQRQAVKVVIYGLLYGMGVKLLETKLANMTAAAAPSLAPPTSDGPGTVAPGVAAGANSAHAFMNAFATSFPTVQHYVRHTRLTALHQQQVRTLEAGVQDLSSERDPNRRKQSSVAWAVQGGAAAILHAAMVAVHQRRHQMVPGMPVSPIALVMSVHDELIYAVPEAAADLVLPQIRDIMEAQSEALGMAVRLVVSVRRGKSLGELAPVADAATRAGTQQPGSPGQPGYCPPSPSPPPTPLGPTV